MADLVSAFVLVVIIVGPFVALALLAGPLGVDSRPSIGDDRHHAPTSR
jgi:hypothetical protein